jgi:hypothetical protein
MTEKRQIYLCVMLLVGLSLRCARDGSRSGRSGTIGAPDPITVRWETIPTVASLQNELDFRITIENQSQRPLMVCRETWSMPTGLIRWHVFDIHGNEIQVRPTFHADFAVTEDVNLVELTPRQSTSGIIAIKPAESLGLPPGRYAMEAEYYCPFEGERGTPTRRVRIESASHRSNRVWVRLVQSSTASPSSGKR